MDVSSKTLYRRIYAACFRRQQSKENDGNKN